MLLFVKHNHSHHHRVLGFFVVIATLYTSIGIGIARGQYYWVLDMGAFLGIVLTLPTTQHHHVMSLTHCLHQGILIEAEAEVKAATLVCTTVPGP